MKSQIKTVDLSFCKFSDNQDLILFLIQRELFENKLIQELDHFGYGEFYYPDLYELIFSLMGFKGNQDDFSHHYFNLINSYSVKINLSKSETLVEQTMACYLALKKELRSRQ